MKKWYKSKTIIVNSIAGVIAGLPELLNLVNVDVLTALGVRNPTKYFEIIFLLTSAINIYFRAQSSTPSAPIRTKSRVKKATS